MLIRCMRCYLSSGRFFSSSSLRDAFSQSTISTEASSPSTTEVSIPKFINSNKYATNRGGSLGGRLFRLAKIDSISIATVISKWKEEGHVLSKHDFIGPVRRLMNLQCYDKALMICDSSLEEKDLGLNQFDYASHLRLVFKVRGLCAAETFFESLPETMMGKVTAGALLHIFVENKESAKAEALMEKMAGNGLAMNPLFYIHIMCLYLSKRQFNKAEEMMKKAMMVRVTPNSPPYNTWLNACAAHNNLEAAEAVFSEMKRLKNAINWMTHSIMAAMYIKHKEFKQAGAALKVMEKVGPPSAQRKICFCLISMHTSMGNKNEVLRLWDKLDLNLGRKSDDEYNVMVMSLLKFDLYGIAKDIMDEWASFLPGKRPAIYNSALYRLKLYGKNMKKNT